MRIILGSSRTENRGRTKIQEDDLKLGGATELFIIVLRNP